MRDFELADVCLIDNFGKVRTRCEGSEMDDEAVELTISRVYTTVSCS